MPSPALPPDDPHDRQPVQATRQAADETYRAIFEASSDAIFVHDCQTGAILDTNPRATEIFGYSAAEFRSLTVVDFSTGVEPYTLAAATARIRAATVEPQTFVWHCRSKLGRIFWTEVSLRRALINRTWRILACVRDVTERIEAAEARDRLLLQEQAARLAAEAAVAVREDFISIASHELKTPLSVLVYGLHQLKRLAVGAGATVPTEAVQRFITRSERQCRRLDQHINMLLDVSRVQAGNLQLLRDTVDLATVTETCVRDLTDDGSPADIQFTAAGPVIGRWDRQRLEQIIINLLSNARKYGQGRPIEVSCRQEGAHALLTVTDHGIGIAPEAQATIFDRFVRAASAQHFSGLGLGLYIARSIAEAHGGTITVASQMGRGSTFTVSLPLCGQDLTVE